jgi:O-antigen biosynthesis protein
VTLGAAKGGQVSLRAVSEPLFSIVTPVYEPAPEVLERTLASVRAQTLGDWEHCLVDDAGEGSTVWHLLERAASTDPRLRIRRGSDGGGIVAASNAALELAGGRFVVLLDHDDELHPGALKALAERIAADDEVDLLYSDEDKVDDRGRHFDPFIKPAWSPDRLRGQMYTGHLCALRRSLVDEVGGFRAEFEGSQDWDLVLRAGARARRVEHLAQVLYHWRSVPASAASAVDAKPWAHEASHQALREQVERDGVEATVEAVPGYAGNYWLAPAASDEPLVSVIVPTAGRTQQIEGADGPVVVNCVRTLLERSTHRNLEIVVVADADTPDAMRTALAEIAGDRLRLIDFERPFNFSAKINVGVAASAGEYLLLLNDDVEVLPPGWRPRPRRALHPVPDWPLADDGGRRRWIEAMLVYARQPEIGAVGAKLYFPDGRLQHAGITGYAGTPHHPYAGGPGNAAGYFNNLIVACDYLAVTAACLMTRRDAFEAAGGFDESLPLNFNDVDYCLRLREEGLRSVCVPWVELVHYESASRGADVVGGDEVALIRARWGGLLDADPYYDRRFAGPDYGLGGVAGARSHLTRARQLLRQGGVRLLVARTVDRVRRGVS